MSCFSICGSSNSPKNHTEAVAVVTASNSIPMIYPKGIDDTFLPKKCLNESVRSFAQKFFDTLNYIIVPIQKIVILKHLVQIIHLPVIVKDLVKKCMNFQNMSREQKIDTCLNACNSLREIGESAATFAVGLEAIKAIPVTTQIWALPFSGVISFLSTISIICKIRSCIKISRLMKTFNSAEASNKVDGRATLASYKAILNQIEEKQLEDDSFIYDTFNTTQEKLGELLVNIQMIASEKLSSDNPEEVKAGEDLLERVSSALKGRVKQNIISSALAITSSSLNIIGTTVLLAVPVVPVGWVFIGLGIVVDLSRLVYHKISEYQFAQVIDLKRTKWEWLTC